MSRAKNLANLIGGAGAGTGGLALPSGTTASRPATAATGTIRNNTTTGMLEYYNGTSWLPVGSVYDMDTTSTGYFDLPSGTTAQRPVTANNGYLRINTSTNYLEVYYNNVWFNLEYIGSLTATGGNITINGNYKTHTFTTSGTFTVTDGAPGSTVEALLIGGGGAGGTGYGGGGGAGGYYYNEFMIVNPGTAYTINVGAGGTNTAGSLNVGTAGGNTTFNGITALGGGGGGAYNASAIATAGSGGSGGGAGGAGTSTANRGTGTQGGNGGIGAGTGTSTSLGGGGGGGGGAGAAASGSVAGSGGIGSINPIFGSTAGQLISSNYYLAGGGGGGGYTGAAGTGGSGGGGTGIITTPNGFMPEQVSFAGWNLSSATLASSNNSAPDGTLTGSIYNLTTTSWDIYRTINGLSPGTTYYFTIWIKLGTATNFCIVMNNTTAWNTIAGSKAYTSADGLNTSSWTKIIHPFTPGTSQANCHLGAHSDSITQQTAGTVHMWGPMVYATTPTQATSGLTNMGAGGGGGGAWTTSYGGNGGSGICIIRYRYQ